MWAQTVRADLLREAWHLGPGGLDMALQKVANPRSGEASTLAVLEQRQVAAIRPIEFALPHVVT